MDSDCSIISHEVSTLFFLTAGLLCAQELISHRLLSLIILIGSISYSIYKDGKALGPNLSLSSQLDRLATIIIFLILSLLIPAFICGVPINSMSQLESGLNACARNPETELISGAIVHLLLIVYDAAFVRILIVGHQILCFLFDYVEERNDEED